MMNSHNCDNASPPWNNAGAMLRAGFTEVPVIGIHTICTNTRDKPITSPAKLPAPFLGSVEPNTTNTKIKVKIASAMNA